ncbi:MAG TPA: HAD family acid phosphatase [Sphingomonas sanguinis]|uniref:HAD family acid phosphatase n=1 Tax=Sphingomonas sanguinis TaxID=33051 RepID=UPI002AC2D687|nr:HAD family acid phosphatase [Sphingomonas sanguinis]
MLRKQDSRQTTFPLPQAGGAGGGLTGLRLGAALAAALTLSGCVVAVGNNSPAPPPPATNPKLAGMQYLYGSAEADAISRQAWNALVTYAADRVRRPQPNSVVLAQGATLNDPRFVSCAGKRLAAVFDVDETVLLNLGFEQDDLTGRADRAFPGRWNAWEQSDGHAVLPTPGAAAAITDLRTMGVTVIFNTNRDDAAGAARAIDAAGLGPAVHGDTLFVRTDTPTGDNKDARRWRIADRYCVIAMGGDQLGDFSDLFNTSASVAERRARADSPRVAALWGRGWFVFPNPVYGKALKGTPDDIFPADRRWHPTGE